MASKKRSQIYFSHDSNARNNPKLIRARMDHGAEGYAVYFMLLERLRETKTYEADTDYSMLAFDFRVDPKTIKSIVEDYGLFELKNGGKTFYSAGFKDRMHMMNSKQSRRKESARAAANARWNKQEQPKEQEKKEGETPMRTHKKSDANAMRTHSKSDANAMRPHKKIDANAMRTHGKTDANALRTQCGRNADAYQNGCGTDADAYLFDAKEKKRKETKRNESKRNKKEKSARESSEGQANAEKSGGGDDKNGEFIKIILKDGTDHIVSQKAVKELESLFPKLDVRQELRNMAAWCKANPDRRKTKRGVKRFINSWLIRSTESKPDHAKSKEQKQSKNKDYAAGRDLEAEKAEEEKILELYGLA